MNIREDEFYLKKLDTYFKTLYGVKLIRFLTKLDKRKSQFTINQPYEEALEYFKAELPAVIELSDKDEEIGLNLEENEFFGSMTSGFKNMNPSLIQLKLKDNDNSTTEVKMKAYCCEGLIKQNTNQKAMSVVKRHFSRDIMNQPQE